MKYLRKETASSELHSKSDLPNGHVENGWPCRHPSPSKESKAEIPGPARRHIEGRARGPGRDHTVGCYAVRMMKSFRNEKEFDFVGVTSISEKI